MFPVENGKFALVRASMVLTYYFKLFHTGADRHNGISMSLLLLVAKTEKKISDWRGELETTGLDDGKPTYF